MANKRKTLLVLLLIVLREAGPTAACSSRCRSDCDCERKGLSSVPQDLPATITKLKLRSNLITSLNFHRNQILIVNEQTFSSLTELQKLHLTFNNLTNIQPQTFSGLSKLRELQLVENQITSIEPGTFSNLPELWYVHLCCNKLTKILPGTFTNLPKLDNLQIHTNKITDIKCGTFADLPQLTRLGLHSNQIRCIQPGAFANLPKLIRLDLHQNLLTSIHPDIISNLPKREMYIALPENPWHCDCRMTALYLYNRKFTPSMAFREYNKIVCQEPSNLRMKSLDDINSEDLICKEPKIVRFVNNKSGTLVRGGTLYLVCEASGIPTPDITVTLPSEQNVTVESEGRVTVEVNGTITIRDVTASDAGQYICTAINPGGCSSETLFVEVRTPTSVMPVVSTSAVQSEGT
ncbi:peroxidasin-like, partial [Branchiostoma floridae]|uniref:Peroxidasin-like n=2 Tax=Branchiostoma floridae TaxID=7739 RepID=A0A9J7LER3_BRAFL